MLIHLYYIHREEKSYVHSKTTPNYRRDGQNAKPHW